MLRLVVGDLLLIYILHILSVVKGSGFGHALYPWCFLICFRLCS